MIEVMVQPSSDCSLTVCEESSKATRPAGGVKLARLGQMLLWLVFPLTLGLAITRQSLWIDEGFTVWFVAHRSFTSFFSTLIGSPGTPGDPQLIFYLFYMWGWIKLFGTSELALRAANIPFAILFIGTMSWASRRLLQRPNLWVYFCLSPFFWFYLNEARPYIALLAFSGVAGVALLAYLIHPEEYKVYAPWCCLTALLFAWGAHIMAAFLFPTILVLAALALTGEPNVRRNFFKDWCRPVLLCSPAFVALGTFYIWVSANGVNKGHGKPGLSNLLFVLYEFAGFAGLGPPRNDIRANPHLSEFAPYWPLILVGCVVFLGLGFFLVQTRPPRIVLYLSVSLMVGMTVALMISALKDVQILGRHMAAFFPLVLLTVMLWANHSFSLSSKLARNAAVATLIVVAVIWGMSDARLVFLQKYKKDSYRDASSIALARSRLDQGRILWAADPYTAYYYGIRAMKAERPVEIGRADELDWPVRKQAVDARNWSADDAMEYLDASTLPIILVLSKADPFDPNGVWRALIQERGPAELARLHAFTVYEWQPRPVKRSLAR